MDSCGVMGRLQVFIIFLISSTIFFFIKKNNLIFKTTENTSKILMAAGYACECRGPIFVKGKGTLITYFVKTPYDDRI